MPAPISSGSDLEERSRPSRSRARSATRWARQAASRWRAPPSPCRRAGSPHGQLGDPGPRLPAQSQHAVPATWAARWPSSMRTGLCGTNASMVLLRRMSPTNLVALLASLGVGCGVLYANPKRAINRGFFLVSVDVAAWLLSLEWLTDPANPNPVLWLRITSAIGALSRSCCGSSRTARRAAISAGAACGAAGPGSPLGLIMAALCFSHYFIPAESTREHPIRGLRMERLRGGDRGELSHPLGADDPEPADPVRDPEN